MFCTRRCTVRTRQRGVQDPRAAAPPTMLSFAFAADDGPARRFSVSGPWTICIFRDSNARTEAMQAADARPLGRTSNMRACAAHA
eukprot:1370793-Pleurochrysis_carterae.AAC.1